MAEIEDKDILVVKTDDEICMVTPPSPDDSEDVRNFKCFLLACIHRRNIDDTFDDEMADWFNSFSPEEFKASIDSMLPKQRLN